MNPPPLTALPAALLLNIISHLPDFEDKTRLRSTSTFFYNFIPSPTHSELIKAAVMMRSRALVVGVSRREDMRFRACPSCVRLRHRRHFPLLGATTGKKPDNQSIAALRDNMLFVCPDRHQQTFCNDCGRDLPGEFRFPLGCNWWEGDDDGSLLPPAEEFVRCKDCGKIEKTTQYSEVREKKLCDACNREQCVPEDFGSVSMKRARLKQAERWFQFRWSLKCIIIVPFFVSSID